MVVVVIYYNHREEKGERTMTVKELREKLAQFDDNMEVKVLDDFGYWETCNTVALITTEEYSIEENFIALENR